MAHDRTSAQLRSPAAAMGLAAMGLLAWGPPAVGETVRDVRKKMGSRFEITVVGDDREAAQGAIERAYGEIDRIEALISSWRESSVTSEINRQAGDRPVTVPRELFDLVRRALKVSELTDGAFDITFDSVGRLWDFKAGASGVPAEEDVQRALADTGYRHVVLDDAAGTVFLARPGTRIGFGALGKGYAANRAVRELKEAGAQHGIVNAGGDLFAFGRRDGGGPWTIGVADPLRRDQVFAHLTLADTAAVTSGDYESFLEIGGKRYAHILDPRTGYPVDLLKSVTVICPDAELADALATAVFVLGASEGLRLVDRLRGIEALIVDAAGTLHFSKNLTSLIDPKENPS